jgi:hypothetical protein
MGTLAHLLARRAHMESSKAPKAASPTFHTHPIYIIFIAWDIYIKDQRLEALWTSFFATLNLMHPGGHIAIHFCVLASLP